MCFCYATVAPARVVALNNPQPIEWLHLICNKSPSTTEIAVMYFKDDPYRFRAALSPRNAQPSPHSNKDVVLLDFLDACSVEERLTLFCNTGSLGVLSAFILCWLLGDYDPTGGMALDATTASAVLSGFVLGLPLLACSAVSRVPAVSASFPVLKELHSQQAGLIARVSDGMSAVQMGIALTVLALPSTLLLLPTSAALTGWAGAFAQTMLLQPFGGLLHLPVLHGGTLSSLLPAALGSCAGGAAAASCFGVRPRQLEVLQDALRRGPGAYFSLAPQQQPMRHSTSSSGSGSRGGGPASASAAAAQQQRRRHDATTVAPSVFASTSALPSSLLTPETAIDDDAGSSPSSAAAGAEAAEAFHLLCMLWLVSHRRVARLAHALACLSCGYLGIVWHISGGNLAAPATAALLHAAAEVLFARCTMTQARGDDG